MDQKPQTYAVLRNRVILIADKLDQIFLILIGKFQLLRPMLSLIDTIDQRCLFRFQKETGQPGQRHRRTEPERIERFLN